MVGAVIYIHMSLYLPEMIAGPNDLAGFIDPPETGLQCTPTHKIGTMKRKFLAIADM
jgi:hypothetical protein